MARGASEPVTGPRGLLSRRLLRGPAPLFIALGALLTDGCHDSAPAPRSPVQPAPVVAHEVPSQALMAAAPAHQEPGDEPSLVLARQELALARPAPRVRYLKGSTHAHTVRSGDGQTPMAEVVRWYLEHGYDFIVVTDHNRVTAPPPDGELLVIPGVELTHNPGTCLPPPPEPTGRCRIHVNSLFVSLEAEERLARSEGRQPGERMNWKERTSKQRVDMYQRALDRTLMLEGMAQLNHPTWHRGVDGPLLIELGKRGMVLVEIANQGFARWNQGTDVYPSTEAIWDEALSAGVKIWGVASDDAHHYYDVAEERARGATVYAAGEGFVMVRAERTAQAIREALRTGEFYGSTGVLLSAIERGQGRLAVEVESPGEHEIRFIGTRGGQGGQILATHTGRAAYFTLEEPGYVRAVVTDAQGRKAWVQPVFLP